MSCSNLESSWKHLPVCAHNVIQEGTWLTRPQVPASARVPNLPRSLLDDVCMAPQFFSNKYAVLSSILIRQNSLARGFILQQLLLQVCDRLKLPFVAQAS